MRFRPCIDIHNGKVKQIIGGTLRDEGDQAAENFVAEKSALDYARLYRNLGLSGGHVILLNSRESAHYPETKFQALQALAEYPGGLQAGGGITDENAGEFLTAGASHVIVTSYVFADGRICYENLNRLVSLAGRQRLTLDLSCRKRDGQYYIVTDRWQKFTGEALTEELLNHLAAFCDEFLVHAVDVEGRASGIEVELVRRLACMKGFPITYAGGVGSLRDLELLRAEGQGRLDVTVGSALDLFGGPLEFSKVLEVCG